jgi:GTPase SAR1 family protein
MGRCKIQIVTGPAGSGKSTYCHSIQEHCATLGPLRRRKVHVANLDPAAENFKYDVAFDVRDLISVDDVMEELGLGPNGGLIYCMEYLLENLDWLLDQLSQFGDEEYLMLDCPGQIELYTHVPVMRRVIDSLRTAGYDSDMVSVFVVDATFVADAPKFISGSLLSLSAMIALELPHINILSKCDLVDKERVDEVLDIESATQLWDIEERQRQGEEAAVEEFERTGKFETAEGGKARDTESVEDKTEASESKKRQAAIELRRRKRDRLTEAICSLLDDFSMVSFLPLNITDEESIDFVLSNVDHTVQYGEDAEVRGADLDDAEIMGNA